MEKPKIVFLKGGSNTGKSTAFRNLKKLREKGHMKNWVFIDSTEFKSWFNYLDDKKQVQKVSLFALIKQIMKSKKNIILEEMSATTAKKYIKNYIEKYNYQLITFEFILNNVETAYLRDIKRVKNKEDRNQRKVLGQTFIAENHKHHQMNLDKGSIFVNTAKLGKKQVVDFILKNLKLK